MKIIKVLRVINALILILYILFIMVRGIRLNLLTIVPIMVGLFYDALAVVIRSKLRKYDED